MDYRPVYTRTRSKRDIAILEQYWAMKNESGVSPAPNSKRLRRFNKNVGESSSVGLKRKRSLGVDGVEVIDLVDSDDDEEVVVSEGREGGGVDVDSVSDGESDEDVDVVSDDENDEDVSSAEGDDGYYESEFSIEEEPTEDEYEDSSEEEKEEETELADNEKDCKGESGEVGLKRKRNANGDDLHSSCGQDIDDIIEKVSKEETVEVGTDVRSEQVWKEERLGHLLEGRVNADGDVGLEEKMTGDGDDMHSSSAHGIDVKSEQVWKEEHHGNFLKGRINADGDVRLEGKRTDDGDDMHSSSAHGTDVRSGQVRNEECLGNFLNGRINADEDVGPEGKVTDDGDDLHSCSAHDTDVRSEQVRNEETLGIYPKGRNNAGWDGICSSSGNDINEKYERLGVAETVLAEERTGCDRSDLYKDGRVWKKEERFGVGLKKNRSGYARNRCERSEGDSSLAKTKSTRAPKQKRVPTIAFQPPKVECLPLRFSFAKKQPTIPEKSDYEREVQNLFEEFDLARAYDEASTDSKANNFTRSDNKRYYVNDEAYGDSSEKAIDNGRRIDLQKAFNKNEAVKGNDDEMHGGASEPGFDKGSELDMQSACENGVEAKRNEDEKHGGTSESGFDKSKKLDMQSACEKGVESKGNDDEMHGNTSESCFDKGSKLDVQSACEKGVVAKENNLSRSSNTRKYYKKKEGARKLTSKTEFTAPKDCTAFTILLDSIYDKGEVSGINLPPFGHEPPKDEAPRDEPPTDEGLPKFFRLGPPPSPPPQKSAREIEEDILYDEMIFAKMSEQIGSTDSKVVETNDSVPPGKELTQHELCSRGKHVLELDEQIGLLCKYCSHVHREIRYIVPDFAPNPYGKSGKSFHEEEDEDNRPNLEDLQCNDHNNSGFSSHALTEGTVWDLIPGVESDMYHHQRQGFEFIWKHLAGGIQLRKLAHPSAYDGDGCIISHAPGTGKTRLTIIFIQSYMNFNPTSRPLIVAPRTMLLTWEEEFKKWGFDIPFHNLNNPDFTGKEDQAARNLVKDGKRSEMVNLARVVKLKSWAKTRSILGISYSLFEMICGPPTKSGKHPLSQRRVEEAEQMSKILLEFPGLVVFDEGHNPRNDQSHSWNALLQLKTRRRILLSGTPFQNNFEELYNTVRLVRPEWTTNLTCLGGFDKKQWSSYSYVKKGQLADDNTKRAREVRHMISPFVHVYKGTILQDKLPGLRNSVVVLQPTPLQQRYSDKTREILNPFKYERVEAKVTIHPSLLLNEEPSTTSMFQEEEFLADWESLTEIKLNPEGGVKARFAVDLIRLCQAMNERVLVFSQWIDPLYLIRDLLMSQFHWREGDEIIYMDGKCDAKQRQSSMSVFNNPSTKAKVLLATTKGCNEGISLVGASRVVLLDVAWNPSVERQAISRAYRLGQKKVVYIYHLLMAGAREEDKYSRQVEKHRLSELVFSCSDAEAAKKIPAAVAEDKILEEMVQHEKLKHIFQSITLLDEAKFLDEDFE